MDGEGRVDQAESTAKPVPMLVRMVNFAIALSGALFAATFLFGFVMFMNAREDWKTESSGGYRAAIFHVEQTYFERGKPGGPAGGRSDTMAYARGLVEGNEEWMDLLPVLGFIPNDEDRVTRSVPRGAVIQVYYDPKLQGEYRVRLRGAVEPAEGSRRVMSATVKHGVTVLALTGVMLGGFLGLRRLLLHGT